MELEDFCVIAFTLAVFAVALVKLTPLIALALFQ